MRRILAECRGANELPASLPRPCWARLDPRPGGLIEPERSNAALLAASTLYTCMSAPDAETNWQNGKTVTQAKKKGNCISRNKMYFHFFPAHNSQLLLYLPAIKNASKITHNIKCMMQKADVIAEQNKMRRLQHWHLVAGDIGV